MYAGPPPPYRGLAYGARLAYRHRGSIASGAKAVASAAKQAWTSRKAARTTKVSKARASRTNKGHRGKYKSFAPGRFGGYVKKGRKVKRKGPQNRMLKMGVYTSQERSFTTATEDCQYIGHASMPYLYFRKTLVLALVKALFIKMGSPPENLSASPLLTQTGEKIRIFYRGDLDSAETFFDTTTVAKTYEVIADDIITNMFSLSEQAEFTAIQYVVVPGTSHYSTHIYSLLNSQIKWWCDSEMKFQNRSVNETGDEDSLDVDNVPLVGKQYEGTGTGSTFSSPDAPPMFADQYGVINIEATTNAQKEPPFGQLFKDCKASAKVRLAPGEIKTSKLTSAGNMGFNRMYRSFQIATGKTKSKTNMGKFRFFALEKLLGGTSSLEILTAVEVSHSLGCSITLANPSYSTTLWSKSAV